MAATKQAVRRWIMTGAVAAVTITGTIYGAQLKDERDVKQEYKRVLEATPEERIAQLEEARVGLVLKRNEFERKIANFHERLRAKEEKERLGPQTKRDKKIAELREQMRISQLEKDQRARDAARKAQVAAEAEADSK